MVLGTLSLYQKRGIFYKEQQIYAKDRFSKVIESELAPNEGLHEFDIAAKEYIIPIDEAGDTDYITAFYQDAGQAEYPYEITIWILIELP